MGGSGPRQDARKTHSLPKALTVFREWFAICYLFGTPLQYSCLENPMDGGAWWAAVHGVAKLDITEWLHFHLSLSCIGEGNGNPLQCSCLKNPRDGGAWWAAVYKVAQSQTRLKWLSKKKSAYLFPVSWNGYFFFFNHFIQFVCMCVCVMYVKRLYRTTHKVTARSLYLCLYFDAVFLTLQFIFHVYINVTIGLTS